jgi:glycosyltransferase involved in cell wall biosynthesis
MTSMRLMHVIATGERRGAEVFASDLIGALNSCGVRQRVAILHASDGMAVPFEAPATTLSPARWRVPVLRIDLRVLRQLRDRIVEWNPHVVQAHGGEALKYSAAALLIPRSRLVYRRIGSTPDRIAGPARRAAYARLIRRADTVVAVAEASRWELLDRYGTDPDRIVTIPNGVDSSRLTPTKGRRRTRKLLGIPSGAPVVLSLGALTWEKDPLGHLQVANTVLRRNAEALHLFAGDGPLRGELQRAIERSPHRDRIRLIGVRDDVGDLLAACDVLLVASRTEGMPAVVIEAGMAGIPVASYALAGVPEVVIDRQTGLLATPGDRIALAAGVLSLLDDTPFREGIGERARRRCLGLYDISAVAPRYFDLYRQLVRVAVRSAEPPSTNVPQRARSSTPTRPTSAIC